MKHNIRYSKDVLWLKPFIEEVLFNIPFKKIKAIKGYKVRKGHEPLQYGSTVRKNALYTINILTHTNGDIKERISVILDTLAHELSHIKNWEHDYKHFQLQALLLYRFSVIIKRLGIKDTSARF